MGSIPTEGSQLRRRSSVGESIRLIIGRSPVRIRSPLLLTHEHPSGAVVSVTSSASISGRQILNIRDHARAILSVLERAERRRLVLIFLISLVSIGLDVISLGLVIPVIAFLSGSEMGDEIRGRVSFLTSLTEAQFVGVVMGALTIVYGLKNLFLLFSTFIQNRFNAAVATRLSQHLLETYFSQPYEFFLNNNSAVLMRNINNAAVAITGGVRPFMFLFSDILIGLGVVVVLLVVEPLGGMAAIGVFGAAGWLFQRFTRRRVRQMGLSKQRLEGAVIKDVMQGIGAAKEIKLLGREQSFLNQHHRDRREFGNVQSRYATIQAVPRLWLETLAVLCLSVLVTFIVLQGREVSEALPVIALFAAAAFRILPSVNRVIASVQDLQYSRPIIATLYRDFWLSNGRQFSKSGAAHEFDELLLDGIEFSYTDSVQKALSGVELRVRKGEAIGIVGASGAGKSTLVDIILGLLDPQEGQVLVNGESLTAIRRSWQDSVGYVPQQIFIADDTVRRNVALGIPDDQIIDERLWQVLEVAQLGEFVRSLPNGLDSILGEHGSKISGGQQQRIGIARALYHDPKVLILDEATSSLDVDTEHGVMAAVESLHGIKTVLIVSHRLSTVEYCNRIYTLANGRVVGERDMSSNAQASPS